MCISCASPGLLIGLLCCHAPAQVLAFSATYTPELLEDLEPLMKRPQRVMLCSETTSLEGVRQFYVLVPPVSGAEGSSVQGEQGAGEDDVDGGGGGGLSPPPFPPWPRVTPSLCPHSLMCRLLSFSTASPRPSGWLRA